MYIESGYNRYLKIFIISFNLFKRNALILDYWVELKDNIMFDTYLDLLF